MELQTFIAGLEADGTLDDLANSTLLQFGTPQSPYLGATILPERRVPENSYRESQIRYKTFVANDGTRFSPAQKKRGGRLMGDMLVELGHQDVADEFTGPEYDAWVALLRAVRPGQTPPPESVLQIIGFVENSLVLPLVVKNEVQRWQAIVNAQVPLIGDNGYIGMVNFPNPAGHRVTAGGDWSDNAYDPMLDIKAGAQVLNDKGYPVTIIVCASRIASILQGNTKIAERASGSVKVVGGNLETTSGTVTAADLDVLLTKERLVPLTINDQRYDTTSGNNRFIDDDVFIMIGATGRTLPIDLGTEEGERILQNTLGYLAIGRAVGQSGPGRVNVLSPFRTKPPRIEGEGWQTSFPVILDPEAIVVIGGID